MASRSRTAARLPKLEQPLDKLSIGSLRSVVAKIMSSTNYRTRYTKEEQPKWWPKSISFVSPTGKKQRPVSDNLRQIIRSCYNYFGRGELLTGPRGSEREKAPAPSGEEGAGIKVFNVMDGSVSYVSNQLHEYASCPPTLEAALPGNEMSASGPLPTRVFRNRAAMPPHSRTATDIAYDNGHMAGGAAESEGAESAEDDKSVIEVFICFFCSKEFGCRGKLQVHQQQCNLRPPELFVVSTPMNNYRNRSPPRVSAVVPFKARTVHPDQLERAEKSTFIDGVGLLPKAKAEKLKKQTKRKALDNLKIEVPDNTPKSPTTPRTPKSLISQLSRDASPPGRLSRSLSKREAEDEESDTESECSVSDTRYRPRKITSLFAIDLCSVLGQRVKKHISANVEELPKVSVNSKDYEHFCHTPVKNKFRTKLRDRGSDFPVTYRKTRRIAPKHSHIYKFTKCARREAAKTLEAGLNRKARALKRQMKKCSVTVQRLAQKDIDRWSRRRSKSCSSSTLSKLPSELSKLLGTNKFVIYGSPELSHSLFPQTPAYGGSFSELMRLISHKPKVIVQGSSAPARPTPPPRQLAADACRPRLQTPTPVGVPVTSDFPSSSATDMTPPKTPEHPSPPADLFDSLPSREPLAPTLLKEMLTNGRLEKSVHFSKLADGLETVIDIDSQQRCQTKDDDVISISSTESDSECERPDKRKACDNSDEPSGKRRRLEELKSAPLLFRCHLCYNEITCKDHATTYIKQHFARSHCVYNIDLIEHVDTHGQKVISIVEVPHISPMTGLPIGPPIGPPPSSNQPEMVASQAPPPASAPCGIIPTSSSHAACQPAVTSSGVATQKFYSCGPTATSTAHMPGTPTSTVKGSMVLPTQCSTADTETRATSSRASRRLFSEAPAAGSLSPQGSLRRSTRLNIGPEDNTLKPRTRSSSRIEVICLD